MMSMNIRSFNKVTNYFKLFYRKKVSESTSLLESSTNYHQAAGDSYLDRIMWMCLFGFKVNRLALTISFVLVYPLLCALLISTEACYAPQHRSTLELCLLFALCILLYKWLATKPLLLVEFLLTKNAITGWVLLLCRIWLWLRQRLLLRLLSAFSLGLVFGFLIVHRQVSVHYLSSTPGDHRLLLGLLISNLLFCLLLQSWRLLDFYFQVLRALCVSRVIDEFRVLWMLRGVFEEMGRAIGRSIKQELGPVTERLAEASKIIESHGQRGGPGGSKGIGATAAGTLAAGGAVGGMAGGAFYAGEEVTSRDVEQLQTQWEQYRSSCGELIESAAEEGRPVLERALHQELNGISDTLTDTKRSVERLWSIAVGLSSGIGSDPPEALSDARWLSDVLRRLTDDNTFIKHKVSDPSVYSSVSSDIEQRWNIYLAQRIGEDVVASEPQPGTGLPESSAPNPVEPRAKPESAAPSVETTPQQKRPRVSDPE